TIYQIKGNVASPLQLHLTDSVNHFMRASFYISEIPNYDSLSPVIKFIEEDIYQLIETFTWK
ncbi:MAG: gliding motility lipoprotein GldD, partial [Prolixibacteraceae bacterium]|nr:gliding motility lipoprotein GldD [Prolixibacteraceae bacterium]